jgi:hypothetical protein
MEVINICSVGSMVVGEGSRRRVVDLRSENGLEVMDQGVR